MTIFFFLLAAILFFFVHRDGYRRGYERGRSDENDWLVKVDADIEAARAKMWKQELKH